MMIGSEASALGGGTCSGSRRRGFLWEPPLIPSLPYEDQDSSKSHRARSRRSLHVDLIQRANHSLLCFRDLFRGALCFDLIWGRAWVGDAKTSLRASQQESDVAKYAMKVHQENPPPSSRERGESAFERLIGSAPRAPYAAAVCVSCTSPAHLKKGDLCDPEVALVSLPPPETRGVEIVNVFHRAKAIVEDYKNTMLRPDGLERVRASTSRPYTHPLLRASRNLLRLVCRLYLAGMIMFVPEVAGEVAMFTVIKKMEEMKGANGRIQQKVTEQRLIFDERLENERWSLPPGAALSGATVLGYLEADLEGGLRFRGYSGDFCVPGITTRDLRRALLKNHGVRLDPSVDGKPGVAVAALLMGFSWSVSLAQITLGDILGYSVPGLGPDRSLIHGRPVPFLWARNQLSRFVYIDDFGNLGMDVFDEASGKFIADEVPRAGEKLKTIVELKSFKVHKEQKGDVLDVFGIRVGGHPPTAVPSPGRFWLLFEATVFLVGLETVEAEWLEVFLGHWTWFSLLCRCALSVWDQTHLFVRLFRGAGPRPMWESVRREFSCIPGISLFLRNSMTLPWAREAYMVDASNWGVG